MPIYEYHCPKCGEFEVTQRITDDPLKRCPECRSKVRKLISQTSFQLKGSGWYITDYARKGGSGATVSSNGSGDGAALGESKAADSGSGKETARSAEKSARKSSTSSSTARAA